MNNQQQKNRTHIPHYSFNNREQQQQKNRMQCIAMTKTYLLETKSTI